MSLTSAVKRKIYIGICVLTFMTPATTVFAMQDTRSGNNQNIKPSNNNQSSNSTNPSNGVGKNTNGLDQSQQTQHLDSIHSRGSQEITRRITYLNNLLTQINNANHITVADKSALISIINNEISGLTALKATLASESSLSNAKADVQTMINEYRVFALIIPQVRMVIYADNQQTNQAKLTTLAGKLQLRLNDAKKAGTDITALQADLVDMNAKIAAAQVLSSYVETNVIKVTPVQYDANHSILVQYHQDLQTAHADNAAAYNDAKTIIAGLPPTTTSTTKQ